MKVSGSLFGSAVLCGAFFLSACGGGGGGTDSASGAALAGGSFGGASSSQGGAPVVVNSAPEISGSPSTPQENVDFSFTATASDMDGDLLSFAITGQPDWTRFDALTGELSGTPSADDITAAAPTTITVSDGALSAALTFTLTITEDALEKAIRTGDVSGLTDKAVVITGLTDTIDAAKDKFSAAKRQLFGLSDTGAITADSLTDIDWDPTHDAMHITTQFGFNEAVLVSNAVTNDSYDIEALNFGVIGEAGAGAGSGSARYMALGSNPMRNDYRGGIVSDDMKQFMHNSLSWITGRDDLTAAPFKVVIAQAGQNYYFPDQVANRAWLDTYYPDSVSYNEATNCDGAGLAACLTDDVDLLIISQYMESGQDAAQIAATVKDAMARGIDVLYQHYNGNYGELAQNLLPLFNLGNAGDNYWDRLQITDFDVTQNYGEVPAEVSTVQTLISNVESDNFTFALSECSNNSCPDGHGFNSEFSPAASTVRNLLTTFDGAGTRIFDSADYRYQKLLVLLGDMYRREAVYPMDKTTTPRAEFLTSYLADHMIYNGRDAAETQADMGNFSRSDFSHVTPHSKSVSLIAKPNFRSTGAYAIPGQSFTVTRTDSSDIATKVFINTLRSGATHLFDNNAYNRPKYLQSAYIPLAAGESLTLTSVYGGPIQIAFTGKDLPVTLSFDNIGSHPYWDGPEDDLAFATAVGAADYDWSELVTAAFEVHSKTEKMQASIDNAQWGSAAAVAAGTERYMSNLPHVLAGFKGVGIDVVDEIVDFADDNGIEMQTLDIVKHMNADQATCGYGCSGNPYDAYWNFDPTGHGDIHELGHGLERDRFRFTGWEGHAVTNPYSYYSKSHYAVDVNDPSAASCQSLPYETMFNRVQQSQLEADPFAYMQAQATGGWSEGVAMTTQFMMAAQAEGVLDDGWHLLARLHIVDRAFNIADNSDDAWLAARAGLGFDGYSRAEALAINNDDWNLIVMSHATGRDMRTLLKTWGLDHSDTASDHVAAWNYPAMPVEFFLADGADFCEGFDKTAVPIDGAQVWPF